MKKNRWVLRMVVLLVISGVMSMTVSAGGRSRVLSGSAGDHELSQRDLFGQRSAKGGREDRRPERPAQQVRGSGTSSAVFQVVTLSSGQTLTGDIGCEVMLRVGTATCVSPSTPGLIDETTAGTLNQRRRVGAESSLHDDH